MSLTHSGFCPVNDVLEQLGSIGQVNRLAIDVFRLFLVDQEKMVAAGPPPDVAIFSYLNLAIRP